MLINELNEFNESKILYLLVWVFFFLSKKIL